MIDPNTEFAYILVLDKTDNSAHKIKINSLLPLWTICPVVLASLCCLWPGAGARVCCKMSPTLVVGFSGFPPTALWPSWFQNISSSSYPALYVEEEEKQQQNLLPTNLTSIKKYRN